MANKNFVVKNGITVGPASIDAATGDIVTTGTLTVSDITGVSQISRNDSSISINDTGAASTIVFEIDGSTEGTLTATALDIPTGSTFQINSADMLTSTGLGSTVINSSLTSVGTLSSLDVSGAITSSTVSGTIQTAAQPNITSVGTLASLSIGSAALVNNLNAEFISGSALASLVQTTTDQTITGIKTFEGIRDTRVAIAAANIDLSGGSMFTKTVTAALTLTVSNIASSGLVSSFVLELTNGGDFAVTWFSGVTWDAATAPTLTSGGKDLIGFITHDGGTTWSGIIMGQAVA